MIQPSYYPKRTTLRSLIYEYNQYEEVDLDEMLSGEQTNILGIATNNSSGTPDEIYTYMYYTVLQKYMFAEIGYDSDELFITRLKATWNTWCRGYYSILSKFFEGDFFNRVIVRNTTLLKQGENTDEIENTVTGGTEGTGQDTEYNVQTKTTTATNNTKSEQERTDTHKIDETHQTDQNVTETEIDPEKFNQYLKMQGILEEFIGKFSCLFMQVFTTM